MGNSASTTHHQERAQPSQQSVHPPPPPFSAYPPPTVFGANGQRQPAPYYPSSYTPPGPYGAYPPPPPGGYSGYAQAPPQAYAPGPQAPGPAPPGASPYQAPQAPKPQEYQRTATVRNQVNLKKGTLKLEKVAGSDDVLAITFKFDATAAGRITTFIKAEEPRRGSKITTPATPAPAVYFSKGLEQSFQAAGAPTPPQHCIDLRVHQVSELLALSGRDAAAPTDGQPPQQQAGGQTTYALVVRLEALTEEGRQGNRQLESLEPGCELPEWVQAQSTYVRLVRDDDGHLGVRVLKQTIWVKGESYELQEIYGMERSTAKPAVGTVAMGMPTTAEGLEEVDGNECVICMSAPRDTAALPCRHMCMCHTCAGELKSQTNKCPICRNEIEKLLHIKIVHKGANNNNGAAPASGPAPAPAGTNGARAAGPSTSAADLGPSVKA